MNICYIDFWPGFDVNCNWFNLVLREVFKDKNINFNSNPDEADIILFSSFGNSRFNINKTKAVKIFYTGENERPDFSIADYSLTFDFETSSGKNFRLPHWFLYVNWWNEPNFPHARISLERLFKKFDPEEVCSRDNFCSIVIGNPVQNRIDFSKKLSKIGVIHGYGRVFGKYYNGCKVELLENYRYNICFENAIYPGYITEKLLEAKVSGCVPIYYGDTTVEKDFNKNCFINLANYNNMDELVSYIGDLENDKEKYKKLVNENLFNTKPDLSNLYSFFTSIMKNEGLL